MGKLDDQVSELDLAPCLWVADIASYEILGPTHITFVAKSSRFIDCCC